MTRSNLALVLVLFGAARCLAINVEDGIFAVQSGSGTPVKSGIQLGPKKADTWAGATVSSIANDNSRFLVRLSDVKLLAPGDEPSATALVVDGVFMPFHARYGNSTGPVDYDFIAHGEESAKKVAAKLKVELKRREHPGHKLVLSLTPDKESFQPGEAVTLTAELRNVGDKMVLLRIGGQQRGPRDNQYRFLPHRDAGAGKALPDIGDPDNHGGLASLRSIKAGEVVTQSVELVKWFAFKELGTYRVTGLFALEMHEMPERFARRTIWEDFAVGECLIHVVDKGP